MEFKVGELVRLKSGGPQMTIEVFPVSEMGIKYDDRAQCFWFDGGELKRDVFPLATLDKE